MSCFFYVGIEITLFRFNFLGWYSLFNIHVSFEIAIDFQLPWCVVYFSREILIVYVVFEFHKSKDMWICKGCESDFSTVSSRRGGRPPTNLLTDGDLLLGYFVCQTCKSTDTPIVNLCIAQVSHLYRTQCFLACVITCVCIIVEFDVFLRDFELY